MSALPPYSTFRTDNKQMMFPQAISHGNILNFTPSGFKQALNVKFPDSRLAVCVKCKKNYKTRDMCRVRNGHTSEPWTTAYICLTLDETCTTENGAYIDKPLTVRMVQWQPFSVRKAFDPKTPVCAACKRTNRTRSFCRERHKHRQLPWCTVYVLLSALDGTDPSTVVAAPSKPVTDSDDGVDAKSELAKPVDEGEPVDSSTTEADVGSEVPKSPGVPEESDNINDIAESRTFLAKVSCRENTIHWLEIADYDAAEASVNGVVASPDAQILSAGGACNGMDPTNPEYYVQSMGYAAQQHQNALKSHQQYFFQMQQRQHQHFAAQQAAWQAHYNHQNQMQLVAGANQTNQTVGEATGQPTPMQPYGLLTAGEAAAQQIKNMQNATSRQEESLSPVAAPPQPWMIYHPYPLQLQGLQQTPSSSAGAELHHASGLTAHPAQQFRTPNGESAVDNGDHEGDDTGSGNVKRQRFV